MPRDLTEREKVLENVTILRALISQEQYWLSDRYDAYLSKRQKLIRVARDEINDATVHRAEASDKISVLRPRLEVAREALAKYDKRKEIARIQKLASKVAVMEAELEEAELDRIFGMDE